MTKRFAPMPPVDAIPDIVNRHLSDLSLQRQVEVIQSLTFWAESWTEHVKEAA